VYLYLDTETTGLLDTDNPYQVAWVIEQPDMSLADTLLTIKSRWLRLPLNQVISPYTLASATYNSYSNQRRKETHEPLWVWEEIQSSINAAKSSWPNLPVHLVGANPRFDDAQLRKMGGGAAPTYHHRLIDIEAYHMGLMQLPSPKGFEAIMAEEQTGFKQSHDAYGDVHALISLFHSIRGF
jgi:hypothetical protein